ncbi:conserved hypothetical protein [Streptomyces sviceus ATCC 29083]|uniref:Uncharacterized protein n=1 Tax=Streptomyces sviceus (strain ATCC 29083 / DSM 924 / JCM 4929 / NBRC 13980 / NCIMB 11184 / NRRL 5439 / UC 5370) TaxID=463191 RepID=B5HMK7_STRX2|nr:conserved hypothetical protein [Streptomyces sviceus ATCC 29083]
MPCRKDGSAGQGWEKCYVLGKESARTRRREPRTDHRRSPPSDNHWSRLTRITHNLAGQASPLGEDPPVQEPAHLFTCSARWGPRESRGPTGCRGTGKDRASPIVVHSRRPHKGLRYSVVTGG